MSTILHMPGLSLDLTCIESVGIVGGDSAWLRYTVTAKSGKDYVIYEKRQEAEGVPLAQYPRASLIEAWGRALNPEST
jgi:hypothetical protein